MTVWDDLEKENKYLKKEDRKALPAECKDLDVFQKSLGIWHDLLTKKVINDGVTIKEGFLPYLRGHIHECTSRIPGCLNIDKEGYLSIDLDKEETPMQKQVKEVQISLYLLDEGDTIDVMFQVMAQSIEETFMDYALMKSVCVGLGSILRVLMVRGRRSDGDKLFKVSLDELCNYYRYSRSEKLSTAIENCILYFCNIYPEILDDDCKLIDARNSLLRIMRTRDRVNDKLKEMAERTFTNLFVKVLDDRRLRIKFLSKIPLRLAMKLCQSSLTVFLKYMTSLCIDEKLSAVLVEDMFTSELVAILEADPLVDIDSLIWITRTHLLMAKMLPVEGAVYCKKMIESIINLLTEQPGFRSNLELRKVESNILEYVNLMKQSVKSEKKEEIDGLAERLSRLVI